jgi:hypothetical protein
MRRPRAKVAPAGGLGSFALDGERRPIFAQNAVLPITAVGAMFVLLGGFIWWMSAQNAKLETVVVDVKQIKESLAARDKDGVTDERMRAYVRLLRDSNPTLKIPEWLR